MQMDGIGGRYRLLEVRRFIRGIEGGISFRLPAIVLAVLASFISLAQAQTTGALHVSSPANGTRVDGRMVIVQFDLAPGISANGIPTFRVQLDRQSPTLTTDTECILYWISPGWHTVTISLVDANGTPIFGAQNQVQFEVSANDEIAEVEPLSLNTTSG